MQKAIHIENTNKNVVRVLSIAEPNVIEYNPTELEYILIEDFVEPPELQSHLSINYPMYDKVNQKFFWVQIQYTNTATEEIFAIENLKVENQQLMTKLDEANQNVDMLTETLADMIGGAI